MANPATLYRFRIELSDVDRGVYEPLDLRFAQHPSETVEYLLTRVIAYALNLESGLEVTQGLCTGDEPAIFLNDSQGCSLWIDIGNPSARRMHKASKAARRYCIYTYKDPELLKREAASESVHRVGAIEVYALAPAFLKELSEHLARDNNWTLMHNEGELVVTCGDASVMGSLQKFSLV